MQQNSGFLGTLNAYLKRSRIGEVLVGRGKLSPAQLTYALARQKETATPLGHILLADGLISKRDLHFALATQSTLRMLAATIAIMSAMSGLQGRTAHASSLRDIPAAFTLAAAGSMANGISQSANLFGTGERASTDLSSFTKWSDMFARFQKEASNPNATGVVGEWHKNLEPLRGQSLTAMADGVNRIMNRVEYIGDNRNWGKSDYWETPIEFLTRGGDCEDFAIAKYTSLRALGVSDSSMRIAIVKDMQKRIAHAILIVYTENGPMVLDNQIKTMTKARDISHYKPIFSINRTAWWIHTDRPNSASPTQIASAAR